MNAIETKQEKAIAAAALAITTQRDKATTAMDRAIKQLDKLPTTLHRRDSAINKLRETHIAISKIDAKVHLDLKVIGVNNPDVFDRPVGKAIQALSGNNYADVPNDIQQMRETLKTGGSNPDMAVAKAIPVIEADLRTAVEALRQMQKTEAGLKAPASVIPPPPPRRPWLLSAWPVVIIFAIALLYAAAYFVFKGSDVPDPLSAHGANKVLDAGKSNLVIMKTMVTQGDNLLEALRKLIEHLIKLISKVPALIAAFGIAYAAVLKRFR
ncbi:hypothetical protein SAMN02787142_7796 [Burkholderia sp. WP9]|uniref:hypothetical protein n=1 Tax=Burkholderia sp. WP9 TaxID=1500263 RepID=UPI00089A176C|nr:hypothetical protein [Burkholderia sp. WP9]SEF11919.1 hypothetical protein SAMN02787142_7796 [Burkholderia sp. WP9]